jgi:hypothetical protein
MLIQCHRSDGFLLDVPCGFKPITFWFGTFDAGSATEFQTLCQSRRLN